MCIRVSRQKINTLNNVFFQGIMLVFDITNYASFQGLDRWMSEIYQVSCSGTSCICSAMEYGTYLVGIDINHCIRMSFVHKVT